MAQSYEIALSLADNITVMYNRLAYLEGEVLRLQAVEKEYHALLSRSIAHGEVMMGNVLTLLLRSPLPPPKVPGA